MGAPDAIQIETAAAEGLAAAAEEDVLKLKALGEMPAGFVDTQRTAALQRLEAIAEISQDLARLQNQRATFSYLGQPSGISHPQAAQHASWEQSVRGYLLEIQDTHGVANLATNPESAEQLRSLLDAGERLERSVQEQAETLRARFPRLYFISDKDLHEISKATNAKDLASIITPHFEVKVTDYLYSEDGQQVTGILEENGEKLHFASDASVPFKISDLSLWLEQVCEAASQAVKTDANKAVACMRDVNATELMDSSLSQNVLLALTLKFTQDVEAAFENQSMKALHGSMNKIVQELSQVSKSSEELDKSARKTIWNMLVFLINQRDRVGSFTEISGGAQSIAWQLTTRIYPVNGGEFVLRNGLSELPLSWEYLGVKQRLIITPLTDRAYISHCEAVSQIYGSTAQGPAGVGKTETVKDIGRLLGR